MSKQIKGLVIALVALMALVIGGVVVWNIEPTEEVAAETTSESVWEVAEEEIKSIKLTSLGEEIEFLRSGEVLQVKGLEDAPRLESIYSQFTSQCMNIDAKQKLELDEGAGLEQYGLSNPWLQLQMITNDDTIYEIKIGNEAPSSIGYYALFNDQVYIVERAVANNLEHTRYDFVDKQIVPGQDSGEQFETLTLQNEEQEQIELLYRPEEKKDEEITVLAAYDMQTPLKASLDTYNVTSWADSLWGLTASGIAVVDATEEEQAGYGFERPISTLSYTTTQGKSDTLTVARQGDDFYMMNGQTNIIYKVMQTSLNWLEITPETLMQSIFLDTKVEDVKKLQIEAEDEKFVIELGEQLDQENFDRIVGSVLGMSPTSVGVVETFAFQKVATITIDYIDGTQSQLELIPTGDGELYMVLDGKCSYTTSEWSLTGLISSCHALNESGES